MLSTLERLCHLQPRVTRTMRAATGRTVNVIRVQGPSDVDDELCAWLTEAYDEATD
jgi:hypothetical protein